VVQQAVLTSRGSAVLLDDLPEAVRQRNPSDPTTQVGSLCHGLHRMERAIIERVLSRYGNTRCAAVALGISRVALYKKRKKYGLIHEPNRKSCLGPHLA